MVMLDIIIKLVLSLGESVAERRPVLTLMSLNLDNGLTERFNYIIYQLQLIIFKLIFLTLK